MPGHFFLFLPFAPPNHKPGYRQGSRHQGREEMTVDRCEAGRLVQVLEAQSMRQAKFGHHNHVTNYSQAGVNSRRDPTRFYWVTGKKARKARQL